MEINHQSAFRAMAVLETWYALLVAVEAADLKRTHSFGKLIIPAWSFRVGY